MKRIMMVFYVLILALTLVACGGSKETPEQAVGNALTAVKSLDKVAAQKYFVYENLIKEDDSQDGMLGDDEILELLFKDLSFETLSSSTEGENAVVKTEITNIDIKPIFGEYIKQAFTIAMSNAFSEDDEGIEDEMEQVFIDLLRSDKKESITTTIDISLVKEGDSWKLDMDEPLQDAILGGFVTVVNGMNESFGNESD